MMNTITITPLKKEVLNTLKMFVKLDMEIYGEIADSTFEAFQMQGYSKEDTLNLIN